MQIGKRLLLSLFSFTCYLLFSGTPATYAQTQPEASCSQKFPTSKCINNLAEIIPEIASANIIYLGETHDSEIDHQNQLKIIQKLHQRNPKIAIAMEMFQRPYQKFIDQYLAGKITEEELVKKTEYEKRWGFPWELYAPILRFAKQNKLLVLAANTPSEITRKVSRSGLESLTAEEKKLIPPFKEIRTDNEEYRKLVLAAFEQHQSGGHGNSSSAERFFLAQVLWDETMAETIAQFQQRNPKHQIVVLAGLGHIIYGYGIPSRVERRLQNRSQNQKLTQRSVLLSVPSDIPINKQKPIADLILESETKIKL
jgi:uncharacterized iron-regulated protein